MELVQETDVLNKHSLMFVYLLEIDQEYRVFPLKSNIFL